MFALAAISLVFATCLAPYPAFSNEQIWKIVQEDKMFGRTTTYVSERGLLREFPQLGASSITLKPDWKMLFFSDETKMCCPMTMEEWRKWVLKTTMGLSTTVPGSLMKQAWTGGLPLTVDGIRATSYTLKVERSEQVRAKSFRAVQVVKVILADDIDLNSSVAKVYSECYCLPFTTKLPLRIDHIYSPKSRTSVLSTLKASLMPANSDIIRLPVGYKMVKSVLNVTTGGMIEDLLNDVVPLTGTSSEKRKAQPHP